MDNIRKDLSGKTQNATLLNSKKGDWSDGGPFARVGEIATGIADTTTDYVKSGCQYVKENPYKGVAIAAGVGAAVGCIFGLFAFRD